MDGGDINLQFSVSATNRAPRGVERHGVDYYFLSDEDFRKAIDADSFLEYEEVYPGRFYGTLKSEIERIAAAGSNVLLDIDVNGALRVKKQLGNRALSLFIQPPGIDELRKRLEKRATDSAESIASRIDRATYELTKAPLFDVCIVNDDLQTAIKHTTRAIGAFLDDKK